MRYAPRNTAMMIAVRSSPLMSCRARGSRADFASEHSRDHTPESFAAVVRRAKPTHTLSPLRGNTRGQTSSIHDKGPLRNAGDEVSSRKANRQKAQRVRRPDTSLTRVPPEGMHPVSTVLIIDDEVPILRTLDVNLRARGYDVEFARSGHQALVFVGTNDYVSKPFGMDELMARLRVALRASSPPKNCRFLSKLRISRSTSPGNACAAGQGRTYISPQRNSRSSSC